MEQTEKQEDTTTIEKYIEMLTKAGRHTPEQLALIRADLDYGLSKDAVMQYSTKRWDIEKMRVYSQCLRNQYPPEEIDVIMADNLNLQQMRVALEFREKGVPIEAILEVVGRDDSAAAMKSAFRRFLDTVEAVQGVEDTEPEYVKQLLEQIGSVVKQIEDQDRRYDALNEKLTVFESTKADEQMRDRLVTQNADYEKLLSSQQDELNQARGKIAEMRDRLEDKEKEMKQMQAEMGKLQETFSQKEKELAGERQKNAETETAAVFKEQENRTFADAPQQREPQTVMSQPTTAQSAVSQTMLPLMPQQPMPQIPYGVSVYYSIAIPDERGNIVQYAPVERMERNDAGITGTAGKAGTGVASGMAALFSKLVFKKKSRQDIVKLVASGDLVPAQLVQIKSAMEKGLTESQLVELINNSVTAEKMKEIIEIAVLENSMAY